MKKNPHWSLLHALSLSKIESTIEHLISQAEGSNFTKTLTMGCVKLFSILIIKKIFPSKLCFIHARKSI